MAQHYHLNEALRGQIVGRRKSGMSISQISRDMGISRPTVSLWLQREQESGNLQTLPKSGRPRLTTPGEDQRIVEYANDKPFTNSIEAQNALQLNISAKTIRRRWHNAEIHHRTPAVKERLEERHIQGRLAFAQEYVDKDLDFWGRVIFSDEKTFSSTNHGKLHCWRRNNTRYDPEHIYQEARSGHVTANYGAGSISTVWER